MGRGKENKNDAMKKFYRVRSLANNARRMMRADPAIYNSSQWYCCCCWPNGGGPAGPELGSSMGGPTGRNCSAVILVNKMPMPSIMARIRPPMTALPAMAMGPSGNKRNLVRTLCKGERCKR